MSPALSFLLVATTFCWTGAATAQQRIDDPEALPPPVIMTEPTPITPSSAAGKISQGQPLDEVTGIEPMARIANRFANRVNNRINNRIERNNGPNRTTTSSFETAASQVRTADPRRRR